ncbi:MAG TPA: hypothetical protein ENJ28_01175 [Gammaproteobacteria bacterium]|nr:hypothetical protein [Gammaproteobacteria bacterium]
MTVKKKKETSTKKKKQRKEPRNSSNVAARNRRARLEALIDEATARQFLRQIEAVVVDSLRLKKTIDDAKLKSSIVAKSLGLFKFLDNKSISKKDLKKNILIAVDDILKAQQSELSTAVIKAEAQNKLNDTILKANFKRLNKVFPDVKSVELKDTDGENPFNKLAEALTQAAKS